MRVTNLNKSFGTKELLKDANFCVNLGEKVGVIGKNGCGKSTLLKILAGEVAPDSGEVLFAETEHVASLKQEIPLERYSQSIEMYLKQESGILEFEEKLHWLENNLNDLNMDEYSDVLSRFIDADGYNFDFYVQNVLNGLNLNKPFETPVGSLSGGEKIKVMLAALLLSTSNVLLVDEPTNNLDFESVSFLLEYLKGINKTCIIVSHDAAFLDVVTTKTIEIEDGNLTMYPFDCSTLLEVKEMEYQKQLELYNQAQDKRNEIKEKLRELRSTKSSKSHAPKDNDKLGRDYKIGRSENKSGALVKKLTKQLEETKVDVNLRAPTFNFRINEDVQKASQRIVLKDLVCGYDDFSTCPVSCDIDFGSKVFVSGKNGSGKTTLLKTIIGELNKKSGEMYVGTGVRLGYIEQNTLADENSNETMLNYVVGGRRDIDKALVYQILNNFGIPYQEKDKPFSSFSAGQRTKINLAKLAVHNVNTLVLDEPTNHLDIESMEILLTALQNFGGTIIFISHNLSMIEALKPNININMDCCEIVYTDDNQRG